jgi:hypothetical protein
MDTEVPNSTMWCVDDYVDIGSCHHLHIVAMAPDPRCTIFSLIADNGDRYRYVAGQREPTRTGHVTRAYRLADLNLPVFH